MTPTDAEKAYLQIRDRIVRVKMPPGSVIREEELMAELGLGRTPIREALKQLHNENLVVIVPRRGMFVADISITDLHQIYEVRLEIEPLAVYLAAERIGPEQLAELRQLATEAQRADTEDMETTLALDGRFHRLMAKACGNRFLQSQIEMLYHLSLRIWHLSLDRLCPRDVDLEAHTEILTAIQQGDGRQARERMRRHIRHFQDTVKVYL